MSQRYSYVAVDRGGRTRSGAIRARTEVDARADLARRKLLPVKLAADPTGQSAGSAQTEGQSGGGRALSHKSRLVFTRQFATLVEAAAPVDEALAMITAQQEQVHDRRIFADVLSGVQEGQRLAEALGRHPKSFPPLYRAAVAGAERTGKLGPVLHRLAAYLAAAQTLRSKVLTAMIYPAALMTVAVGVISALMILVVPTLSEQFRAFDAALPLLTRILMATSEFLVTFWPLLLIATGAAALSARSLLSQPKPRGAFDRWLLRAPVIGRWAVAVNASRFVRALSMLAAAGMPVLESVRASREAVANRAVAEAIDGMAIAIEAGEPLSQALRASGVIPPMVTYMAASGENAGELPAMLEKAADHLDQEFEAFTTSALALLEPAIIVTMGAAVAGIVLAIMLPILQLNRLAIG